jgi:hypothetical protein
VLVGLKVLVGKKVGVLVAPKVGVLVGPKVVVCVFVGAKVPVGVKVRVGVKVLVGGTVCVGVNVAVCPRANGTRRRDMNKTRVGLNLSCMFVGGLLKAPRTGSGRIPC